MSVEQTNALSGRDLQGLQAPAWYNGQLADLRGSDLSDANLRDANFWLADLGSARIERAILAGANLEGADLVSANLRFTDLTGANLDSASLRGADLTGANLDSASLRGADLTDAVLSEVRNWRRVATIEGARLLSVRNAPPGFLAWAADSVGAVVEEPTEPGDTTRARTPQ